MAAASGSLSVVTSPRSAMRMAWRSRSILNGPQLAGWVTAMPSAGPPSASATRSTTQRSSFAISASAEYGVPDTMMGVGSPSRRLNSRATRDGSVAARRAAAGRPVVLNPLVSLSDSLVDDRGRFRPGSAAARVLRGLDRAAFRAADLVVADVDEDELEGALFAAATRGFDLAADLPVRASLFRLADEEHALLLVAGLLFWWPIVSGRLSPPAGLAYLVIAFIGSSFLGLAYIFSSRPFYAFYEHAPRLWGLSPIHDQNLGGILMNGEQTLVFLLAIGWFVMRLLDEEHARDEVATTASEPLSDT